MKLKITDIKTNPKNPRLIKDDKFEKLVQSLKDFPVMTELREVIVDENNMIIGGNMRHKAAKQAGWAEISVKVFSREDAERNNKETGKNKNYEEYIDELTIKDNISGGEWDWDMLYNQWDTELLDKWGLTVDNQIDQMNDGDEIEFEQSVQIEPPQEFIMIICEPNSVEWEEVKEKLKLKMVRRGGYKKGSPFDDVGLERLIMWSDFKRRYDNSSAE